MPGADTAGSGLVSFDSVSVVDGSHPVMAGLTNGLLSNWGQSVHQFFTPAGSSVFTNITNGNGRPAVLVNEFEAVPEPAGMAVWVVVLLSAAGAFVFAHRRKPRVALN